MELEELPPNKPNFPLIVGLFVVAIVLIVATALFFVQRAAKQEPSGHVSGNPLSLIIVR